MISNLRINRFAELAYESDDEKYELALKKEAERKEEVFQLKMKKKEEKRMEKNRKESEQEKKADIWYGQKLRKTKEYDTLILGDKLYSYVSNIVDDSFNIACYLSLDSYCIHTVDTHKMFHGLFQKDDYLELVKIMELNKTDYYPEMSSAEDIRKIQCKIEIGVMSGFGSSYRMIYEIYLILLLDTKCMRKVLTTGHFGSMMGIFRQNVKNKIENEYRQVSETHSEYFRKYFEVGKRYIAKRNNFKVLFRNYVRFVGKLTILYRKSMR